MTAALEVGEWSAARPGRTLLPGKTRYPSYRRLGGPQGRSGRAEKSHPHRIRSRTVHPVAQSLYRLSYRTHNRNEYQEYFLRSKGGRCVGLTTLPPSCADYIECLNVLWRTAVAQWLRCCATNQILAGSIPAGVIGIFH